MAAPAAAPPPWIPEDDLLLKNAVEAGASLEALAKGAVRFSRRFTIRELRDRWRSLLYDADVAAEASSRMVHLQLSSDYSFPNSDFPARYFNYGAGACSSYAGGSGVGSSGGGSGRPESAAGPSVKRKVESVRQVYNSMRKKFRCADAGGGFRPFGEDCGFGIDGFGFGVNPLGVVPVDPCCSHGGGGGDVVIDYGENVDQDVALFECDFVTITDALMNFATGDDGLDFIDVDGEDVLDKCRYDGLNLLVAAPDDLRTENVPTVTELQELVSDEGLQIAIGAGLEIEAEGFVSADGPEKGSLSCLETNFPSSDWAISTSIVQNGNEEIECVLNTEDPEIPCNDDFIPIKRRPPVKKGGRKEEYNHPQCLSTSLMIEAGAMPIVNTEIQNGSPSFKSPTGIIKQSGGFPGDVTQGRSIQPLPSISVSGGAKKISIGAFNASDAANSEISTTMGDIVVSDVDPPILNQYESESDDDVPSFSDIEAMILDLDLCPNDLDSVDMEAIRYQSEDSKRTIMRLEQCARSSMHRRIASQGAFAVLYGHRLKHYIKQPEVILGRATEDMDVDIDLAREGPANKISRRQALVRMEADGSFLLKNLGKSLVFVNGKEVLSGQSVNLTSSSLIEIRGMAFVFEADNKRVRNHIAKKRKEESVKFEWASNPHGPKKASCSRSEAISNNLFSSKAF